MIFFMVLMCVVPGNGFETHYEKDPCDGEVCMGRSLLQRRSPGTSKDVLTLESILKMEGATGDIEALQLAKKLDEDEKTGQRVSADINASREVIHRSINELESSVDVEDAVKHGVLVTEGLLSKIEGSDYHAGGMDAMLKPTINQSALVETNQSLKRGPWPSRTVKYCFASDVSSGIKDLFSKACTLIMEKTCLSFEKIAHKSGKSSDALWKKACVETKAIFVQANQGEYERPPDGDWSKSGGCFWLSSGILQLSKGCETEGIVLHEIGHALGMDHEHVRNDRDGFVKIQWDNMGTDYYDYFKKKSDQTDLPYDYLSLMHYGKDSFGKQVAGVNQQTIKSEQGSNKEVLMGQRHGFSRADIQQLNKMYSCTEEETGGRLVTTWDGESKCLDFDKGSHNVHVHTCNNGLSQKWYWDSYSLKSKADSTLCLERKPEKGFWWWKQPSNIFMRECNDGEAQSWSWQGHALFSWDNSGDCLDYNYNDGDNVWSHPCHNEQNQKWWYSGKEASSP